MDFVAVLALQVLYAVASLALISAGLAIIFGMLRVINFAHGEFLMMGGYAFVMLTHLGVNTWVAMLVGAPLIVGLIGVVIERLVIRHLYGRTIETILATWGLSLFLIGLASTTLGYFQMGVTPPFGSLQIGRYQQGGYMLFVIGVSIVSFAAIYLFLRRSRWGLIARATMQNAEMASALGVARERVYAVTFFAGAAFTGLAGAVMAPISGVVPTTGIAYIARAFITVIPGGTTVITGTVVASVLFGTVSQVTAFVTRPVVGEAALLLTAVILLRFLPSGITPRFFRRGL
jgi:branched-subunit amino acid ABC-type transport system permease component